MWVVVVLNGQDEVEAHGPFPGQDTAMRFLNADDSLDWSGAEQAWAVPLTEVTNTEHVGEYTVVGPVTRIERIEAPATLLDVEYPPGGGVH